MFSFILAQGGECRLSRLRLGHGAGKEGGVDHGQEIAMRYKSDGAWQAITYGDLGEKIRQVSKALIAMGIDDGTAMTNPSGEFRITGARAGAGGPESHSI